MESANLLADSMVTSLLHALVDDHHLSGPGLGREGLGPALALQVVAHLEGIPIHLVNRLDGLALVRAFAGHDVGGLWLLGGVGLPRAAIDHLAVHAYGVLIILEDHLKFEILDSIVRDLFAVLLHGHCRPCAFELFPLLFGVIISSANCRDEQ